VEIGEETFARLANVGMVVEGEVSAPGSGFGRLSARLLVVFAALAGVPLLFAVIFMVGGVQRGYFSVAPGQGHVLAGFAIFLALGGVFAAAGLSMYLHRVLSEPIRELRQAALRLAGNDTQSKLSLADDAELAGAAAVLSHLADRVSVLTGDLQGRVAERTRELGRAMGELQLLKKLNDAIIHNIPSGIAVVDDQGRLLYVNAWFERRWKVGPQNLGGRLRELGAGGPLAEIAWDEEVSDVISGGEPRRRETVETGRWPNRRVIQYSLFPLPPSQLDVPLSLVGEEFCLAVISPPDCARDCENCFAHSQSWRGNHALLLLDDITEQRQLEAQLIQSEKLAALGQLSAGVAHEIRNPLSAIGGAAFYIGDVLTDESPDLSDIEDYVRLIERNVDRAQRIVTDILDFSRPSDAEVGVNDLTVLARQTLAILDKAMVDQNVVLHEELSPEVLATCRAETIKQALLNLIVNGMQAMPEGGQLTVRSFEREGWGYLSVGDTGTGIEPDHLSQIFNPFFTTKPAGQGTGLGLSIARQAVENDGGRLTVESRPGEGTTFRIALPAAESHSTAVKATDAEAAGTAARES